MRKVAKRSEFPHLSLPRLTPMAQYPVACHRCKPFPLPLVSPSHRRCRLPLLPPYNLQVSLSLRFRHPTRPLAALAVSGSGEKLESTSEAGVPEEGLVNGSVVLEEEEKVKHVETEEQQKLQQKRILKERVVFGLGIGLGAGGVILAGGWPFAVLVAAASFVAAREYFEMMRSRGMVMGMTPPPRYVSRVCSVICALMPLITLYFGQIDVSVISAAFIVAIALILQRGNPRFAQLSSTMFGLFYCGYLPCFWIKLRCGMTVPALNTKLAPFWPILLGGPTHWTVGLIATLISVSSIIAADTFAFLGGRVFGRTPLIGISPKKTMEGAIAGLTGCVIVAITLWKIFCWPTSLLSASAFGVLNFFGSLFGDLIESVIKRDAGVKDSGSLIPGHGGVLDRVDGYVYTGALSYSFVKTALRLYGV